MTVPANYHEPPAPAFLFDLDGTLSDLVRAVHTATTRALAHQDLQFANMVELAKPDRDPARLPLVQVMFAMEESWAIPDRGGLRWRPELIENASHFLQEDAPDEVAAAILRFLG